jgi:citrate synthase
LHGTAAHATRALLADVADGTPAATAVGDRLRHGEVPGFGHRVYTGPDPRVPLLLDALAATRPPVAVTRAVSGVVDVVASRAGPPPNVDFALGAYALALQIDDRIEALFAIARCAGFVAHAMEEYEHRLRFRPRATYTGPRPPAWD